MEVKTKYNLGDPVYILDGYAVRRTNIGGIGIDIVGNSINITYRFPAFPMRREKECFKTKEDLIKYLNK